MKKLLIVLFAAGTSLAQNFPDRNAIQKDALETWKSWKEAVPGINGLIRAAWFGEPYVSLAFRELAPRTAELTRAQRYDLLWSNFPISFRSLLFEDFLKSANETELAKSLWTLRNTLTEVNALSRTCEVLAQKSIVNLDMLESGLQYCPEEIASRLMENFYARPHGDLELFTIATKTNGEFAAIFSNAARIPALRLLLAANRSKAELMLLFGETRFSFPDINEEIARRLLPLPLTAEEREEINRILLPNNTNGDASILDASEELRDRMWKITRFWSGEKNKEEQQ